MREETILNAINDLDSINCMIRDIHESIYQDTPDYWTRLEHQAAIATMQGILASPFDIPNLGSGDHYQDAAIHAAKYAHALVEKYKKEK